MLLGDEHGHHSLIDDSLLFKFVEQKWTRAPRVPFFLSRCKANDAILVLAEALLRSYGIELELAHAHSIIFIFV